MGSNTPRFKLIAERELKMGLLRVLKRIKLSPRTKRKRNIMSESAIRAQIKVILSAVSNIGNVYDTKRYYNNQADRLAIMKTTIGGTDQIRA